MNLAAKNLSFLLIGFVAGGLLGILLQDIRFAIVCKEASEGDKDFENIQKEYAEFGDKIKSKFE